MHPLADQKAGKPRLLFPRFLTGVPLSLDGDGQREKGQSVFILVQGTEKDHNDNAAIAYRDLSVPRVIGTLSLRLEKKFATAPEAKQFLADHKELTAIMSSHWLETKSEYYPDPNSICRRT